MVAFARYKPDCLVVGTVIVAVAAFATASAQVPAPMDPLSFEGPDPSEQYKDIKIEQNLDAQVPLDLEYQNEEGQTVTLGELMNGKPALLSLVYYECPMLCNQVMNGIETVLDAVKYKTGDDYEAIVVSIDPDETPELAQQKKQAHVEHMVHPEIGKNWHFLTGNENSIDTLADTIGYRYVYDPKSGQYAHAAGITLLTPEGKISKYYHGIEYIPRDVEFGLNEASQGKIGSLVDDLVLLCFQYDPNSGQYGFYIIGAMRIGAVIMIAGFLTFWGWHWYRSRNRQGDGYDGQGEAGFTDTNRGTAH